MKLLAKLADRVPEHWTVIVMSDRGLYAPWLYAKIVSLGWHPFMRINKQGHFRPQGEGKFRSLATAAPEVGSAWCGQVDCFSSEISRLHVLGSECGRRGRCELAHQQFGGLTPDACGPSHRHQTFAPTHVELFCPWHYHYHREVDPR